MPAARIRLVETRTIDLEGHSLAEIEQAARAATPTGWELLSAPVKMIKGSTKLTAVATIARRDQVREIEAPTREQLDALVPDGWQMLSVRAD
jgi:hypothetical protein